MKLNGPAFGFAVLFATSRLFAAEPPDDIHALKEWLREVSLSGSVRGGYWSSSRDLDDRRHLAVASVWLKATSKLGSNASFLVEGWVGNPGLFREDETIGALREAYLKASLGPLDLSFGREIIPWGRADRINPTDNLTPKDFSLLVPDDDDQRLGTFAIKGSYYLTGLSLTVVWLPEFKSDTIPIKRPPPLFRLHEQERGWDLGQWAIKVEQTEKRVDWSLSFFDGLDRFPDLGIGSISPSRVKLRLRNHRIQVIGADAATVLGRYGLRGEVAFTFTENSGEGPEVKNPFFFMVAGGDRTFFEHLNVNIQYLLRVVTPYRSPFNIPDPVQREVALQQATQTNQLDRVQHGASLRVSDKWFNETLEGEAVAVIFFTRGDYAIRPKLTYAFTDRWKGTIGADLFRGPDRSFFGNLRDNSTAFIELRWSF
ncbi:MAG: hypothetical protein HY695_35815 [Deltaproteobacteria bacterium]|nr:hypothetical protein [Deltaproteobacteria bacterium]